jgi:hypothetical protein
MAPQPADALPSDTYSGGTKTVQVSAAAIPVGALAAVSGAAANPWLIAVVVALASFMEVLDTISPAAWG